MPLKRFIQAGAFLTILAGNSWILRAAADPQKAAGRSGGGFGDFSQRIEEYLKIRKGLPREHTNKRQKEIVDRRHALAQAIRESRPGAKQGDIFTPAISEEFLKVIRSTLQGSSNVRKTIRQGEPVAGMHLSVNGAYPQHLPVTTVPPTLLRNLPELPDRVAYRIIGHDFVLQDTEARLIIDYIPGALP